MRSFTQIVVRPLRVKYTWAVSESFIALLDINVSISGNRLSTSMHYKPTDSHSYLLHSSSHQAHVKNSIPYSQFLRLGRLCSDDPDFTEEAEEMCQFFQDTRLSRSSYPQKQTPRTVSSSATSTTIVTNKLEERIPLTLTFHPHNISVKNIILKNFSANPPLPRLFRNHSSFRTNGIKFPI